MAFFHSIITDTPRPEFDWKVEKGELVIQTDSRFIPKEIRLWQATNDTSRDFRIYVTEESWTSEIIPLEQEGLYRLGVENPENGWTAFFAELTFSSPGDTPFKITSGVVVTPDDRPYPAFTPKTPKGTRSK